MKCYKNPVAYEANQFLSSLYKTSEICQLKQVILEELTNLADKGQVYVPVYDELDYEARRQ